MGQRLSLGSLFLHCRLTPVSTKAHQQQTEIFTHPIILKITQRDFLSFSLFYIPRKTSPDNCYPPIRQALEGPKWPRSFWALWPRDSMCYSSWHHLDATLSDWWPRMVSSYEGGTSALMKPCPNAIQWSLCVTDHHGHIFFLGQPQIPGRSYSDLNRTFRQKE